MTQATRETDAVAPTGCVGPRGRLGGLRDVNSIAKLGSGGGRYYIEKGRDRVDHRRAVASGADDYYLAGPEVAGTWVGTVARELDLEGREVTEEALDRACPRRIRSPVGASQARSAGRPSRRSI